MTQKKELVLTALPGGQREPALRDSFTAHLRRGPYRSRPGWHLKLRAGHPKSAGWPRSAPCAPRGPAGRDQVSASAQGTGQPLHLPCLPAAGRNRSETASARPGTKDAPPAERPPPGRVESAWFGRRCPPAPATALKFNSASGTSLYGRARGKSAGEIDAPTATPRRPAGCPAPCNYLTALTEPRNLRESPASSLLSGGRKGNKEAF